MWDETSFFVMTNLCCTGERDLVSYSVSLRLSVQCPDKKGRRCGLTQLLTSYPPPYPKSNTSKGHGLERKNEDSIFYVIDKQTTLYKPSNEYIHAGYKDK